MRRIIALTVSLAAIALSLAGCDSSNGRNEDESNAPVTSNIGAARGDDLQKTAEDETETGKTVINEIQQKAIKGNFTGTDKTFTGLEALGEIRFEPDESVTLDNKCIGYSYGVSKNGVPHENSLNAQKKFNDFGAVALDESCTGNYLYLTFDCGYENGYTAVILDALKEKQVPAAFFVTLDYIKRNPALVARMINEGHIVGNHSATHPSFPSISRKKMAQEIQSVDNYLRTNFGYSAPFFRFPKGEYSDNAMELVKSIGYQSVFWSVAYADWDTSVVRGKDYAVKTVCERLHKGAIILLHSVSKDNAEAMGEIIDRARQSGYEFMPL